MEFVEEDPKLIARLLLFLYTNYYPHMIGFVDAHESPNANQIWFEHLRALLSPSDDTSVHEADDKVFRKWQMDGMATNAAIHALADRLDVSGLAMKARKAYLQAEPRIHEDHDFEGFEDFAQSIRVVYSTTSSIDRRLRDIALFAMLACLHGLRRSENENDDDEEARLTRKLLASTPQYALELLTMDVSKCHTWCEKCQMKSPSTAGTCFCGMRGICGQSECADEKWSIVRCGNCMEVGGCRKAVPEDSRLWIEALPK